MGAEFVPLFQIGEIASALACNHYLASGPRHLLKNEGLGSAGCCSGACHETCSPCSDYYDVVILHFCRDISAAH